MLTQATAVTGVRQADFLDHETPFLAFDLERPVRALQSLRAALPGVAIHYAVKCNSDPRIVRALGDAGTSFEIASEGELRLLQRVGVDVREVLFSTPVKPVAGIAAAHRAGVTQFAFDSRAELVKLAAAAPGARVYVRLATRAAASIVHSEGKFGVDTGEAVELLLAAREMGLVPWGIGFHVGSQMDDGPAPWQAAIGDAAAVMDALLPLGVRLRMVDIGGGLPAHYRDRVPPVGVYGEGIRTALEHLPYRVQVVAEPGRYLVAEAGTMVCTVIGVATRGGRRWVHVDVGAFNGAMEALETGCGLRFPVTDGRGEAETWPCVLTGPSGDSQDTVLHDVPLSRGLRVGDRVYLHTAGAYTTCYTGDFCGLPAPSTHTVPGSAGITWQ